MTGWLLRSIGIGDELAAGISQARWLWARPTVLWVGLLLLVPMAVLIVARHRQSLGHVPPRLRLLLTVCRVGVLAILLLVLAGPYVKFDQEVIRKPVLALIVDDSRSMSLPAGPFDPSVRARLAAAIGLPAGDSKTLDHLSRLALVRNLLGHEAAMWRDLEERFELRVYRTAGDVRPGTLADVQRTEADPAGDETDLGQAIQRATDDATGKKLAGIVLISDGRWTTGPDPLTVVRRADSLDAVPVWAVPPGGMAPPADVAVADVLAPPRASLGDTATVIATVESEGFDGRPVHVRLLDAAHKPLDDATLTLRGDERQQVQLNFHATEPGPAELTVAVDEQPEELVKENNRQRVMVRVDTERLRVLYVEGYPRWDFRFLDHALRRDQGLDVTTVVEAPLAAGAPAGTDLSVLAGLPQDAAALAEFNTVILGDVSPAMLTGRFENQLAVAVQGKGLGLIVQPGPFHLPREYSADSPLLALLPVRLDASIAGGILSPAFSPFHLSVTAAGAIHPILELYTDPTQNRQVWGRMPEFYWAAAAVDAKPAATVLAECADKPLIAEQFTGRGRVLFVGTDATYRWRRNIGDTLFYRFWGQAIRYVARDKKHSGDQSWMEVYPQRVEPGRQVSVRLYAVDSEGRPVVGSQQSVAVAGPGVADQVELTATDQPGQFHGVWQPKAAGAYSLTYTDMRQSTVTEAVEVAGTGRELRRPIIDRDELGSLADATGGGLIGPDRLDQLPDRVKGQSVTIHIPHQREIWDNWVTLLLLVGLYCTDVAVRRIVGMP